MEETRKSYHDIGICVVAVEDKVTDLLRKILANELSNRATPCDLLLELTEGHGKKYDSFMILQHLVGGAAVLQELSQWVETEEGRGCTDTFVKAFEHMIRRFPKAWDSQVHVDVGEILGFLGNDQSEGYKNLTKILIEVFMRQMKLKASKLNDFLGKEKDKWKPLGDKCFDEYGAETTEHDADCKAHCPNRYRITDKGQWDWVDDMNYIRNIVVHRFFKYKVPEKNKLDQEKDFREKYGKFIDGVDFPALFPSNGEAMKKEYMKIMTVHDDMKEEVGKLKGEVGRLKDEVERLSKEHRKPEDKRHSTMGGNSVKDRIDWWNGQDERSSKEHRKPEDKRHSTMGGNSVKGEVGRRKDDVERLSEENRKPEDKRHSTMGGNSDWMDKNKEWEADGDSEDDDDKHSDKASHVEEMYHEKRDKTKIKNWNPRDT